ncbi:MAG: YihY/virulence factor BrkB family protein, partial [Candidatus Rokuibacteriota bacterium]
MSVASPPRAGRSFTAIARQVWRELGEDEIVDRAAALSYYFVFALFPTLLFLAALLGLLPTAALLDQLIAYMARVLPVDAFSMLTKTLEEILRGARGSLVSLGALVALWAASNGMGSIITALNAAYDVTDTRPRWKIRLVAVGLTVVFSGFTLTALTLLVLGPPIAEGLAQMIGLGAAFTVAWNIVRWPVALALVLVGVGLVYYLAPTVKQRWSAVAPGAVFAVAGWLVASAGLRFYVAHFANYNA